MLSADDLARFPDGVRSRGDLLVDEVRRGAWPMNGTAVFVLERTGAPLGSIVDDLAAEFGLAYGRARADVLGFVLLLNAQLLLNIEHRGNPVRRWAELLRAIACLAPMGMLPSVPARRKRLDTTTPASALYTSVTAVAPRALLIAAAVGPLTLQLSFAAGVGGLSLAGAIAAGVGLAFALHEGGHAAALTGVPAALVVRGRRTFVLHGPLESRRRMLVALAGPAPVAGLGAAIVALAVAVGEPLLALGGVGPATHALSLTVATGDGRSACGL